MFFYDATVCYVALADAHELHCAVDELGGDCEPCCVGVCFSARALKRRCRTPDVDEGDTVGSKRPFDWALTWLETAKTLSISESVKSVRLSFMRDMSDSGLKGDRDCSMRLSSMMTESSRFMGES